MIIIATIKDIAKYAGVSIATVSKYLNGGNVLDTNKKMIDEAIDKFDYKVNEMARGLKTNKTMTVGVLIPSLENIFFTTIVSNIENILLKSGYSTIVCDYRENLSFEKEKLEFLIKKRVDGIIMVPDGKEIDHIRNVFRKKIPVVMLDRIIDEVKSDAVITDNVMAAYQAVEYLINKGHERIGIICGPENLYTSQKRLNGYYKAYEEYGLDVDPDLIEFGDYQIQGGYDLFMDLLELKKLPSAIFVTNYEMTLGAIMAVNEKNIKVPDQLSLIGFDNIQMAKIVKPSLSIVVQPMKKIAETAARLLLKRLDGDLSDFPQICKLKAKLLKKDSVCSL